MFLDFKQKSAWLHGQASCWVAALARLTKNTRAEEKGNNIDSFSFNRSYFEVTKPKGNDPPFDLLPKSPHHRFRGFFIEKCTFDLVVCRLDCFSLSCPWSF
jgi:hypothetical protein